MKAHMGLCIVDQGQLTSPQWSQSADLANSCIYPCMSPYLYNILIYHFEGLTRVESLGLYLNGCFIHITHFPSLAA